MAFFVLIDQNTIINSYGGFFIFANLRILTDPFSFFKLNQLTARNPKQSKKNTNSIR